MEKSNLKIGLVGIGNMGSAIYEALISKYSVESVFACDKNKEKIEGIPEEQTIFDSNKLISKVDVVIIAVKPQSFNEFVSCLEGTLDNKLVLSIMAGVTLGTLYDRLKTKRIIRAMPNLAITAKHGFTGWIAGDGVADFDITTAQEIFGSIGAESRVYKEDKIDQITALSGSGPAYFFYLVEILEKAAKQFGFGELESKRIALQTFFGAAELLKTGKSAKELRESVTSKGGTTEAAFKSFEENNLEKTLIDGIKAAYDRSKELNK